jgi:hypothetical protein
VEADAEETSRRSTKEGPLKDEALAVVEPALQAVSKPLSIPQETAVPTVFWDCLPLIPLLESLFRPNHREKLENAEKPMPLLPMKWI